MDSEELGAWLRLSLTPQIGNETARRLLAAFGLPQDVFRQPALALRQVVSTPVADALHHEPEGWAALLEQTLRWLGESGPEGTSRRVLTLGEPDYPPALLATEDPPLLLYVMGRLAGDLGSLPGGVAIVGSRNPTPQGQANARQFAHAFASTGLAVVSGMALGIDGAAHTGAMEGAVAGQLATIAVVGTGLDRVYPKQHAELAHRIAEQGLLISEYPLGTPPLAPNFPRRNRIIAGLSLGTLVVEAALRSGSLITARMAVEQGKEVFAIPGSIHSTQSRGCHALIRQGAKLVESAQDVLEELRLPHAMERKAEAAFDAHEASRSRGEAALIEALGFDPVGLDALVARTGIDAAMLQAMLLELELDGAVARLPGALFQRQGAA